MPRRISRLSRKPSVTSMPTLAPLPSSMVLVAIVEPCTNSAQPSIRAVRLRPSAFAAASTTASTPCAGLDGTDGSLNTQMRPCASARTMSVNVPPMSTPMRHEGLGAKVSASRAAIVSSSQVQVVLNAEICLLHLRVLQQGRGRVLERDAPRLEHVAAIGQLERQIDALLDQQDRQPF